MLHGFVIFAMMGGCLAKCHIVAACDLVLNVRFSKVWSSGLIRFLAVQNVGFCGVASAANEQY